MIVLITDLRGDCPYYRLKINPYWNVSIFLVVHMEPWMLKGSIRFSVHWNVSIFLVVHMEPWILKGSIWFSVQRHIRTVLLSLQLFPLFGYPNRAVTAKVFSLHPCLQIYLEMFCFHCNVFFFLVSEIENSENILLNHT